MTPTNERAHTLEVVTFVEPTNSRTVWIGLGFLSGGLGLLIFTVVLLVRPRASHMTDATVLFIALTGVAMAGVGLMVALMRQKLVIDRRAGQIGDLQPLVQPWAPRFRPITSLNTVTILHSDSQSADYYLELSGAGEALRFAYIQSLPHDQARRIGRQIAACCKYRLIDASSGSPVEIPATERATPLGVQLVRDDGWTDTEVAVPRDCRVKWVQFGMNDVIELPPVGFRWRHVFLTLASFAGLFGILVQVYGQNAPGGWPILEVLSSLYAALVICTLIRIARIRETIRFDEHAMHIERRYALDNKTWRIPLDQLERVEIIDAAWRDRTLGPLRATSLLVAHATTQSCTFGVALSEVEQRYLSKVVKAAVVRRYQDEFPESEGDEDDEFTEEDFDIDEGRRN